jgi:hypothetical protein
MIGCGVRVSASPFQEQGKKEAVDSRKLAALQEFTFLR